MMLIEHPDGRREIVNAPIENGGPAGYPGATIINADVAPHPHHLALIQGDGTWAIPVDVAERWARERIEDDAEEMTLAQFRRIRRQMATVLLWNEVQRLKLATGNFTNLSLAEKARQFPTLAALAQQSGSTIPASAAAVESRLWDRVRRMALAEAKLLLAHDSVRNAATPEAKIAAAEAVEWKE